MTEQQVPQVSKMMGELVAHQSAFNVLSKADRQFVIQQPKGAIELMVVALRSRPKEPTRERTYRILRPVAPKPAVSDTFKADETFFNKKSGVKMVEHGSNFTSWFTGKVEEGVPAEILVAFVLTQGANDTEIITDLGGEEKAEVTLAEIWRLIERQASGREGVLLTNGWANIFYVRDVNGLLRAVGVGWYDDGWGVYAYALDGFSWYVGGQVFSRNS